MMMTMTEGVTSPNVAVTAPAGPLWMKPVYVAMFTPMAPGGINPDLFAKAKAALADLPPHDLREMLSELADYVVARVR